MLCDACLRVLGRIKYVGPDGVEDEEEDKVEGELEMDRRSQDLGEHHANFASFEQAVEAGCSFCQRQMVVIGRAEETMPPLLVSAYTWYDDLYGQTITLEFTDGCEKSWNCFSLKRTTEIREFTKNTGSDQCLAQVSYWLNICREQHTKCERPRDVASATWKPTRLVYVHPQDDEFRLVEHEEISYGVKYCTLSHCWGQVEDKIVLTAQNIRAWKARLPDLTRMKTFTDAIEIARRLGSHYIWIDSLCIIQNSRQDWRHESVLMSNVYKYSSYNISATSATDDTIGCFFDRDLKLAFPLRLQFSARALDSGPTDDDRCVEIVESSTLDGYYELELRDHDIWRQDVTNSIVNKRAWVLQERVVAPRIIHFTYTQLYWECGELHASENRPRGLFEDVSTDCTVDLKKCSLFTLPPLENEQHDRRNEAWDAYENAIDAYSHMCLTQTGDKLVAISAIMRQLQPFIRCRYLAGHWEDDLIWQLGWEVYDGVRPVAYRAPSWSWASVDGHVKVSPWRTTNLTYLLEILEANVDLVGEDEFGQVSGGYLRVRGHLIEIDVLNPDTILVNGKRTSFDIRWDDHSGPAKAPLRLHCLPLKSFQSVESLLGFDVLCLEQVEPLGSFQRVGLLRIRYATSDDFNTNPLLSLMGQPQLDEDGYPVDLVQDKSLMREITIV
ncbi:hypothetical protein FKW77_010739 [Venturia effusa]|uniref:Heterokaryon incompatibility domain-containing protein n=1 Tax=Venturia effusa TaxID=50376 RepID=A0A517KYB1_9PEZI|nr:hypothetical protein FKW77_010739 [Venturia effusa]